MSSTSKRILISSIFFLLSINLYAQQQQDSSSKRPGFSKRLFKPRTGSSVYDKLYNNFWAVDTVHTVFHGNKSSLLIIPGLSYAQETKLNLQFISLFSFYTAADDSTQRNSTFYATTAYSQLHQFRFRLHPVIWTRGNLWHLIFDLTYQRTNSKFYGTGNHTLLSSEELLNNTNSQVDAEAEHLVVPHVYGGLSFIFQNFQNQSTRTAGIFENSNLPYKFNGHAGFGGATLIFDNRDNQNYTTHGHYVRLNAGFSPGFLSSSGDMQQYNIETRDFFSLDKKNVLGLNVLFNSNTGNTVPYYFLNQLGSDQMMRGYYQGRFRDRNLLAAQMEYRWLFFPRFGLALFAGAGQVFGQSKFGINQFKPDYGFGGRYVFDLKSRITIRLDYGRGLRPAGEKVISGYYLSLGEAF